MDYEELEAKLYFVEHQHEKLKEKVRETVALYRQAEKHWAFAYDSEVKLGFAVDELEETVK